MTSKGILFALGLSTLVLGCATQSTKPAKAGLEARFQGADANQDGKLSRTEYGYSMIEEVFARYDKDKNGVITLKEFVALGGSPEAFQKIDRSGNGTVTIEEAKTAKVSLDAMTVGFYAADVDKDGYVTLGEAIAYREKVRAYMR